MCFFRLGAVVLGALATTTGGTSAELDTVTKLALFDFELEDFSAGAAQSDPKRDAEYLARATEAARRVVAQSGRYSLVETRSANAPAVKEHRLHACGGCEAAIAAELGADRSLVGIVHRVSRTEYWIRYEIRDARTGDLVSRARTELRLGADYSWDRGARWLIDHRLLASKDGP
jgi:hypothetical protein